MLSDGEAIGLALQSGLWLAFWSLSDAIRSSETLCRSSPAAHVTRHRDERSGARSQGVTRLASMSHRSGIHVFAPLLLAADELSSGTRQGSSRGTAPRRSRPS